MNNTFTTTALRINNTKNILRCIYRNHHATPLMLHEKTSLSRPTIAQILKDLQNENLIFVHGLAKSTGGRKANLYEFHASAKISIGVEILSDHFELTAVDLYGDMLKFEKHFLVFSNTEIYFDHVCEIINTFIKSLNYHENQILGVGIALQALISADGTHIIYGEILNCTGLTIETFQKHIPFNCAFVHDAESMANVELWFNPLLQNAVFFNIRSDVSGAIIINRNFFQDGAYKSGIFEHMTLVPNGLPCYCGKRGCLNAYCSISALLAPQENTQYFFTQLRKGASDYVPRWNKYLDYLALAINNLHMTINSNIILGGTLAHYLIDDDIERLHQIILKKTAFPTDEKYISISTCSNLPACIGSALPFIQEFLNSIL